MFKLSDFFKNGILKNGTFSQTQFANTSMLNSICFASSKKYLYQANENEAISAIITNDSLSDFADHKKGIVITPHPEKNFYELHNILFQNHNMKPIMEFSLHKTANIHPSAIVSDRVFIGRNVEIGPGAIIEDYAFIEDNVKIGPRAIIGAAGHFYKKYNDVLFEVEHAGGVCLKSNVKVLAGAIISKAVHNDFTAIDCNSVISINSHIGHGCKIGKRCVVAGNAQISGYTSIGDDVWIGPSATIRNLIQIGDRARIEIGSVVVENIPCDGRVSGNFALPHTKNLRCFIKRKKSEN